LHRSFLLWVKNRPDTGTKSASRRRRACTVAGLQAGMI
jgi:hypothetical protein